MAQGENRERSLHMLAITTGTSDEIYVGHLNLHGGTLIVTRAGATGTIAIEQRTIAKGQSSGYWPVSEFSTGGAPDAMDALGAAGAHVICGSPEYIRVNAALLSAGSVQVWVHGLPAQG